MVKKEAVANTSSILFLAKLKRFDLLKNIFSKILIPTEVKKEMFFKNSPENKEIKKEMQNFIKEIEVKDIKSFELGEGEKAAISLCLEKNIKIFVSDDKKARKLARGLDIKTIGLAGIIKYNLEEEKLSKQQAKKLIDDLIKNNYYISSVFYIELLNFIGKS